MFRVKTRSKASITLAAVNGQAPSPQRLLGELALSGSMRVAARRLATAQRNLGRVGCGKFGEADRANTAGRADPPPGAYRTVTTDEVRLQPELVEAGHVARGVDAVQGVGFVCDAQ